MRVEVGEGASATGIEVRLARAPVVSVSGVIKGAGEKDYPNFFLEPSGGPFGGMMMRPPRVKDGRFSYPRMAPGRYILLAVSWGEAGPKAWSEPIDLDVADKDVDNLELNLQPPVDLEGVVKWTDEDKGKAETLGQLELTQNRVQVAGTLAAEIEDGNKFHLKGAGRDRYPVLVTTSKGGAPAIQSVEMGGVEMPGGVLDLRYGAAGPVTIVLSPDTGQISGKLENAKASSVVALVPEPSGRGRPTQAPLGPNGEYEFKSVPVGDYKLVVLDVADLGEVFGSGLLGYYEAGAKQVKVRAQDTLTIDLKQP